ncbi:DUF6894 family protein [Sphingomonas xinjiangensis]|uniref:DUF6894 domain-containing protein n=1 Tax=Sphingomonas xinjiangensis TaxID=643568 RepID=A0A840YQ55_9SPHN|nr:hypothetical protein [Sphingomonas xinjiangensis]
MPRFHFRVLSGSQEHLADWWELPDVPDMKACAFRLAGDLIRDLPGSGSCDLDMEMNVTNDAGLVLFTITMVALEAPAIRLARP